MGGRVGIGGLVRAADWAEIGERVRAEDGLGWVGIGGLVREEDELAVLACVNYQGTAFLRLYHKMLLLGLLDIFEALQNRKKLILLLIAPQMF